MRTTAIAFVIALIALPAMGQDKTPKKPARDTVEYCNALKREAFKPACLKRAEEKTAKAATKPTTR